MPSTISSPSWTRKSRADGRPAADAGGAGGPQGHRPLHPGRLGASAARRLPHRRFRSLAQFPTLGRSCDDIRPGYRKYAEGAHVIFYREVDGGIEIARILHGRMDLDRHP
jgi:plasmid stabilization system protein ParE